MTALERPLGGITAPHSGESRDFVVKIFVFIAHLNFLHPAALHVIVLPNIRSVAAGQHICEKQCTKAATHEAEKNRIYLNFGKKSRQLGVK